MMYKLVEKANHLAVHALFDSKDRAERHLAVVLPEYIKRGYLMNKALRPCDFEVIAK